MPAASLTRKRRSSAEAISGGVGGERRLMRLAAMRDSGESYSDVILGWRKVTGRGDALAGETKGPAPCGIARG
jgi:hypothetical protein